MSRVRGNVPATIWSEFMTKAHQGKQIAQIPGGSYEGQLVVQPVYDPATGQVAVDPATGQAMTQYVDAGTVGRRDRAALAGPPPIRPRAS